MSGRPIDHPQSLSFARSLAVSAVILRRQLWIWPLFAAALLVVIGLWGQTRIDEAIHVKLASELETILNADVAALKIWLESQRSNVASAARSQNVERLVGELLSLADQPGVTPLDLAHASAARQLAAELAPCCEEHGYSGWSVVDVQQRVIADQAQELIGKQSLPGFAEVLPKALSGTSVISHPFPSLTVMTDEKGRTAAGMPTMYAVAPVRGTGGKIVAALGFRLRPDVDFTPILSVACGGKTGETFAFNRQGLLLSESRFDDDLKRFGLITDLPDSRSILTLELRDPGVDLTTGARPTGSRSDKPLIKSVAAAAAGNSGVSAGGYRGYRGVDEVAAWTWLDEYDFGVATEIEHAEADAPLFAVRPLFWGLFALLCASAIAVFIFTVFVSRLRLKAQHEALNSLHLGQYALDEKIGQGAMGVVYRGHHAMLRRPTAIKLLDVDNTTDASIARFEREVRLTSQLNHPNTISIYDFGHTPEGLFYYAMELLDGIDLDRLVHESGPLSEGRVIHLLTQLCGSLSEAHGLGLIHRDIKPANIMVCQRGRLYDVIKLLDFGLVKAVDAQHEAGLTAANSLTGTPLYLAPEAIMNPELADAPSDLYALGAVAYFLLTGTTVFSGDSLMEIFWQHLDAVPEPPSGRLGRRVDPELEALILRCLAKDPADRFASAEEIDAALRRCVSADTWNHSAARDWWQRRRADQPIDSSIDVAPRSLFGATVIRTASPLVE